MALVAGVDFGTLSVRVTIVNDQQGPLGMGSAALLLQRDRRDPDFATQSHCTHMRALAEAMRAALADAGVDGESIAALALDTTGSSVVPVGVNFEPLDDYYLWCDHRAHAEAQEITDVGRAFGIEALEWCGGVYSHEWGFAKLLHWLRHNPTEREHFVTALEHCDMVAAHLTGNLDLTTLRRSVCAMGHKWMWNPAWGGFPSQEFLSAVDPLFDGIRAKLAGVVQPSDKLAGTLCERWAAVLGLPTGIPIPTGAFDAHWDAVGAGARVGDLVNVVGTSTCIITLADTASPVRGVCGVVPDSAAPGHVCIEAGLSAVGDILDAIARRAGTTVGELSRGLEGFRPGQTGLLRMTWDNGDRTVLIRADLGGVTFGWDLGHTAQDELFAAIEGTGFHTRIILDRLADHDVRIDRVINTGGIPQRNHVLNQVYANILGREVIVPDRDPTGFGACIFASVAAGSHATVAESQNAICSPCRHYHPDPGARYTYDELYGLYRSVYFALGGPGDAVLPADLLPTLSRIRRRQAKAA